MPRAKSAARECQHLQIEMTESGIPVEVTKFIADHISSIELAEVLALLYEHPSQAWTVAQVNQSIRSSESSVAQRLNDLLAQGFLIQKGSAEFQYQPKTEALAAGVRTFLDAYKQRRIKVIELIFARPMDQVRIFSDAFRFRKLK